MKKANYKKIALSLGTISLVLSPLVFVLACGNNKTNDKTFAKKSKGQQETTKEKEDQRKVENNPKIETPKLKIEENNKEQKILLKNGVDAHGILLEKTNDKVDFKLEILQTQSRQKSSPTWDEIKSSFEGDHLVFKVYDNVEATQNEKEGPIDTTKFGKKYIKIISKNMYKILEFVIKKWTIENELNSLLVTNIITLHLVKIPENHLTESDLDFIKNSNFTYTITHDAITGDGPVNINVAISNNGETKSKTFNVNIVGINNAKQKVNSEEKQKIVNDEINTIKINKSITLNLVDVPENSLTTSELGFIKKASFAYNITHSNIEKDGNINVTIIVSKNGKSQQKDFLVNIKGINDAKKLIVDQEQQKVVSDELNTIKLKDVLQTNLLEIEKNSLKASELDLNKKTDFVYTISHDKVSGDGLIDVDISVEKNGKTKHKTFQVNITGINDAKQKATSLAQQEIVDDEINDIKLENEIKLNSTKVLKNSLVAQDLGFSKKIGFTYRIESPEITSDGQIDLTIIVSQNGKSKSKKFKVNITGINDAKKLATNSVQQKIVDDELSSIKVANGITWNFVKIEENSLTSTDLGFVKKAGFNYIINNDVITGDGPISVGIFVEKDGKSQKKTFQINVTGIDNAKQKATNLAQQKIVDDELKTITLNKDFNTNQLEIDENSLTASELGLGKNPNFTYSIKHNTITSDGEIDVIIFVSQNGKSKSKTFKINIIGINDAKKLAVDLAQQEIVDDELNNIRITSAISSKLVEIPKNSLTASQLVFTKKNNFSYTISHDVITGDGTISVDITVEQNGKTKHKAFQINVTGIDNAKQKVVDDELNSINISKTINTELVEIAKNSLVASDLGFVKKAGFTYKINHDSIATNGELDVIISVSKDWKLKDKIFKVNILGIENAKQKVVNDELNSIAINNAINTNLVEIAANSLIASELGVTKKPGFTYTISHSPITSDGNVDVTINVVKDGKSQTKIFQVNVVGINNSRNQELQEVANKINKTITIKTKKWFHSTGNEQNINNILTIDTLKIKKEPGFQYSVIVGTWIQANDNSAKIKIVVEKYGLKKEVDVTLKLDRS